MFSRAQQLEVEEEFYAKQDDIRERYHCQIRDMMDMSMIEQEYTEYMTKVWDAGYGYDSDAYEAAWSRMEVYYKNEPEADQL
jgi:hypothetical protein